MAASKRNYGAMKDAKLQQVHAELVNGGDAAIRAGDSREDDRRKVEDLLRERGLPTEVEDDPAPAGPRIPFAPQLAAKASSVEAAVRGADCVMEPKADGWRLMVERDETGIRAWLRSGEEATHRLPHHVREWGVIMPPGTVLDGELCSFKLGDDGDPVPGSAYDVHTLMRRTTKDPDAVETSRLKYLAFDILRHGTTDLVGLPLRERSERLDKLLRGSSSKRELTYSMLEWREAPTDVGFRRLLSEGWEGCIVKDLDAPYSPGARGHGVSKLKAAETVDAVVMGVGEGKGELSGMAGFLEFGQIRDGVLTKRGTVSSGLTFAERDRIWADRDGVVNAVIELRHMGAQDGLRHPVFLRWRDDLSPNEIEWHDSR